jgi:hypothetical protein
MDSGLMRDKGPAGHVAALHNWGAGPLAKARGWTMAVKAA